MEYSGYALDVILLLYAPRLAYTLLLLLLNVI